MAVSFLTSSVVTASEPGISADHSAAFDSGATGSDRVLVVFVGYENGGDPGVSAITYDGVSLTKQREETVSPSDDFSETIECWTLVNPSTGSNTLQLTNSANSVDTVIMAAVYTGANQSTPVGDLASFARQLSQDGTFAINKSSVDDGVVWGVIQDRGNTTFTPVADNNERHDNDLGDSGDGFSYTLGDMFSQSGSVTSGTNANGTSSWNTQDIVGIGVVLNVASAAIEVDLGLASESNGSFPTVLDRSLDVGLSQETSSSFALGVGRSFEVGLATESDQSFGVSLEKTVDLGLASESDQTFSVALERLLDVGLASESDIAFSVSIDVVLVADLGLSAETDSAFSAALRKDVDLGLSSEADVAFSIEVGAGKVANLGLSFETSTAFSMEFPKDVDLGVSSESTQAFSLVIDRSALIGLSSETNTAFSVFIDAVLSALLGLARESTRSFRLDSGLPPFRWAFYDQTTPGLLPSRRRFRPLILTDRGTGKTYVIKLGDGLLLELEEADKESQMDELFLPFQEPTMKVGEHTVRIYVENGDLKWEFYSHHVRNRPILFGKVLRPKPRQPRYILILDEGVLDETEQDT